MKRKIKERIQGSISVLLVIILLPTMVLSALIVDTARVNMASSMVSSAGDLAINSALADYDTILKDVYGLFAMSQAKTDAELAAEIKGYFEDTLVSYGVVSEAEAGDYVNNLMGDFKELVAGTGSMEVNNFLDMEVTADFLVTKEANSGLNNPQVLRRQIVDYMKYRAPANFGLSFLDSVKAFTTVEEQTTVVKAQVEAQESLQPVTQGCRTVIDGIRAFDDTVTAMNDGDQAVVGLTNSTDTTKVPINKYHEQIDKYKAIWGEKYQNINELTLIFLLKSPEVTGKYLSGMSYTAGDYFIKNNEINAGNSGISVEVDLEDEYEAAGTQMEQQRTLLAAAPYTDVKTKYSGGAFLDRLNLDTNKTKFENRTAAIDTFIAFERFLLNDAANVEITYNEVAATLEQLCVLDKYYNNYKSLLEAAVIAKAEERDNKKTELDNKTTEVANAQTALDNGEAAQEAVPPAQEAWETAQAASETALEALNTANTNLSNYSGSKSTDAYKQLKEAAEAAQEAYDEAVEAEEAAKEAYDEAVEAAPTDAELAQMQTDLSTKQSEQEVLNGEYEALKQEVESLESLVDEAKANYEYSISAYNTFTNEYQHDLELYEDYRSVAKLLIEADAKAIQTQVLKIQGNVQTLMDDLNQIGTDLSLLKSLIKTYNDNVDLWEKANNDYVTANSSDTFSKQNAADISSTESQYNVTSLETLLTYIQAIEQEYRTFYEYVTDANRYKYGNARIDTLNTSDGVKGAVPDTVKNTLPSVVTVDDANGQLNSLYTNDDAPSIEIDPLTFVKDSVLPIQFLKYLNENYPVEKKIIDPKEGAESTSKSEEEYNQMKESMKENKEGKDKIESVDGNSYGYTFQGKPDLDKSKLPSNGKQEKTATTDSMTISEDDDKNVNASDSMGKQNENLSGVLGNVGKVLETGLENIYLVDYIFENFSYNTIIQEMVVEKQNLTTYPQVMNLTTNAQLSECLGEAKTLSNYNITGANNYLYGAEVEYILFGNKNPTKNVNYTKASIYAIRFAFNTIFAFTDSEIRNLTRAAGLAVQAATLGFVPYQLVQIVLQLALAAGESAIDLDMMSKGLKVVVVKTKDTWNMSISGAIGLATDAASAAATNMINSAVGYVNKGINAVMEAATDELKGAVGDLTSTVSAAAKSKGQEIVDGVFTELQNKIDEVLNEIQFIDFAKQEAGGTPIYMSKAEVDSKLDELFGKLKGSVNDIAANYAGNPIADAIMPDVLDSITGTGGIIDEVRGKIDPIVEQAYAEMPSQPDVGGKICDAMLQIKFDIINMLQDKIGDLSSFIDEAAQDSISDISEKLNTYAQECVTEAGEELSEAVATEVKDKVVTSLNEFSNTYLKDLEKPDIDLGAGGKGNGKSTGASVASMINFGYKDYLMLLTFITVCVNDDAILGRTADVIQLNMQNATGTVDKDGQLVFKHQKGNAFTLAEARTYVTVKGNAKLDMLFLDLDFFNGMLKEEGTDINEQMGAFSTIKYQGVAGY